MPNKGIANFQFGIVTADSLGKCQDSLCSMLDLFKAHVTCKLLRSMLNFFFFYLMNSKVLDAAETFYFSSTSTLFLVIPLLKVACPPCHLPVISTVIGSQLYTYSIKMGTLQVFSKILSGNGGWGGGNNVISRDQRKWSEPVTCSASLVTNLTHCFWGVLFCLLQGCLTSKELRYTSVPDLLNLPASFLHLELLYVYYKGTQCILYGSSSPDKLQCLQQVILDVQKRVVLI